MKSVIDLAEQVKDYAAAGKTIAPVENGTTAVGSYAIGEKFIREGVLYKAKTSITAGDALTLNTNYELADNVVTQISDVKQALTDLTNYDANTGVKNLLPVLLESGTLYGLTFTKDSDSLIANGTSTGDPASISLFTKNATAEGGTADSGNKFTLEELGIDKSKSYILTCENNSNFKIRVFRYNNSTLIDSVTLDIGASSLVVTFPANCDRIGVALVVINGTTLTNARIKPMLRLETISDSTYQPYAKPNTELTVDTKGLTDNQFQNGAVNLFENKATSATSSGFTMIVNADKSVTANGSGSIYFELNTYTQDEFNVKFAGKSLKISGTPESLLSNDIRIYAEIVSSGTRLIDEYNSPIYTMPTVSGSVRFYIKINGTVTNAVFKPMITLADMPNSDYAHYVQYAKSNKELTEDVATLQKKATANVIVPTTVTTGLGVIQTIFETVDSLIPNIGDTCNGAITWGSHGNYKYSATKVGANEAKCMYYSDAYITVGTKVGTTYGGYLYAGTALT